MHLQHYINCIKARLPQLYAIDFGYPLGENCVRDAIRPSRFPDDFSKMHGSDYLSPLYAACDGLSLPDVHSGYFLKPLAKVCDFDRSSEPDTVACEDGEFAVLPFGSTGGGGLFVVDCQCGRVLLLSPGPMRDGRFDGTRGSVKEIAATVSHFIEHLYRDFQAFIDDDRQHTYMT